jgi:cation transport regulator ChaB
MPRAKKRSDEELPSTLERSDEHAQEIFTKTLENAEKTYGDEAAAHRVAYASLKHSYQKSDEGDRWVPKPEKGPSDPQAARGPTTRKKSTDPDRAPTALGKVATTGKDAEAKAKEAKREYDRSRRRRAKSGG